jgi:hypothetical protein
VGYVALSLTGVSFPVLALPRDSHAVLPILDKLTVGHLAKKYPASDVTRFFVNEFLSQFNPIRIFSSHFKARADTFPPCCLLPADHCAADVLYTDMRSKTFRSYELRTLARTHLGRHPNTKFFENRRRANDKVQT